MGDAKRWIAATGGQKTFYLGTVDGPAEYVLRPADGGWTDYDFANIQLMLDGLNRAADAQLLLDGFKGMSWPDARVEEA